MGTTLSAILSSMYKWMTPQGVSMIYTSYFHTAIVTKQIFGVWALFFGESLEYCIPHDIPYGKFMIGYPPSCIVFLRAKGHPGV
jgi:hypothetical protein